MPWGAAAAAVATVAGSVISGNAAKDAANTSADAQRYAADQAAAAAKFTPYNVTTGFGSSKFDGTNASYTLTPEMQAIRDRMIAQAGAYDTTQVGTAAQPLFGAAANAFNLGSKYLATSPEEAAAAWLTNQRNLLAPQREQTLANIRNQQFQTGRTGLATGGTVAGGMAQSNPEMAAYYNSLANQDLTLASQADQYGQARANYGLNMYGTGGTLLGQVPALTTAGYGPLGTQLGMAGQIEGYGQQALDIGAQLGGRSATAGAQVANALLTGGTNAARTAQLGNSYSPVGASLMGLGSNSAFQNWFTNKIGGNNGITYGGTGLAYDAYGQNPYAYTPQGPDYSQPVGNLFSTRD